MAVFLKIKRILIQNRLLYRPVGLFSQFYKVYGKNLLWIIRGKTSYSTLKTCHRQITTRFEFYNLDLVRETVIWCNLRGFGIFISTQVQYLDMWSSFLYFSRARKYQNRIRHEILGVDMRGFKESKKTPSWSKSRKTPSICRSAQWSPNELNSTK